MLSSKAKELVSKANYYTTCSDILWGKISTDNGYIELDEDMRLELFNHIKDFVKATSRAKRKERIANTNLYNIRNCGILGRLWIRKDGEVEYCAGQDYVSEMGTVREVFAREI